MEILTALPGTKSVAEVKILESYSRINSEKNIIISDALQIILWYFNDCGIRNYILGDWRPLDMRGPLETGHLWENYLVAERAKWRLVHEPETRDFFWRTAQQQEVDMVEESASGLKAFEFKWNPRKGGITIPRTFRAAYPDADCRTITPNDILEFL